MPSYSVIIPAYNAESTVARAIRSAREQQPRMVEVIVACDGCTDRTLAVSEEEGAVVLDLPKANGSVARNQGARVAAGDLFFFLDADDWWEAGKVESHLAVHKEFDGSFVTDRSTPRKLDGSPAYWRGGKDFDGEVEWQTFLSHQAWAGGSSFSVTKENYWRVNGFNEKLQKFQDVDFWLRCAFECGPARTISKSYTNYRLSESGVSRKTESIEQNLSDLFSGWPFVSSEQKRAFRSYAFLLAAEFTPWPDSVPYFRKAHWPVLQRYFWKCVIQSFRARRMV
ncbi:MAG: glycosyltransferase family 2 protein [Armatimonadetes bacterium]|nr:glycosyltransferase family 2 protein [Armatimonadota bacterium]